MVAAGALLLCSQGLTLGFGESDQGWSGGFYGQAVRHLSLRDGLAMRPERDLYLDHPPAVVWLGWLASQLLGEGPLAMRLFPWLAQGAATAGVLLLARPHLPRPWPALVALGAIAHPLVAIYGSLPDPQGSLLWAAVVWACVFAQRGRLWGEVGMLILAFCVDWPTALAGGLLALFHTSLRQRGAAIRVGAATAAMAVLLLAWIALLGGWEPLWGAFAHRVGLHGVLDEAGAPLGWRAAWVAVGQSHLAGATWPLTLVGAVGVGWLAHKRRVAAVLPLLGLLWVGLFVQGAAIHRYWQIYAVQGLGLAGVWLLAELPWAGRRWLQGLVLAGLVLAGARAGLHARSFWLAEAPSRAELVTVGRSLRQSTPEGAVLHSNAARVPALAWHAERVIVWESDEAPDVLRRGRQWTLR